VGRGGGAAAIQGSRVEAGRIGRRRAERARDDDLDRIGEKGTDTMAKFRVAESSAVVSPVAYRSDLPARMWLTSLDVARLLGVTTRWVRWLARAGELACETTESGQRLFRRDVVRRVLIQRAEDQARHRPAHLALVRVRMLKAGYPPRQLSFLKGLGLRIVTRGERSLPQAEVKAARSFDDRHESDSGDFVNRRSARR
jgi:MerR HTH family regulatory protein